MQEDEEITEPIREVRIEKPGTDDRSCTCYMEDGSKIRGIIRDGKIYREKEES